MSWTAPPEQIIFSTRLDWKGLPVQVVDPAPDSSILLRTFSGGDLLDMQWIVHEGSELRMPKLLLPHVVTLVGVKSDGAAVYVATNLDLDSAAVLRLAAVNESGGGSGGGGDAEYRVAGTVAIKGAPAAREIFVVKEAAQREVLASGQSAGDGTFDISYFDWDGPVLVIAVDEYGQNFEASTPLNVGDIVHPSGPNGRTYAVTVSGVTGETEPAWPTTGSIVSGSVTFAARPYYRPAGWGPYAGEPVA